MGSIGIGIEILIFQVLVLELVLNFCSCQVLVLVLVLKFGPYQVLVLVLVLENWYRVLFLNHYIVDSSETSHRKIFIFWLQIEDNL